MANSATDSSRSRVWAWPVGLLLGLAIGIPSFGPKGGVAFGVAMAVAFGVALGAARRRFDAGGKSAGAAAPAGDDTATRPSR
jgi:hypothetical protein